MQVLRELQQDARHTFRLWAKRRWQTGFAILALAIGIGANTGVFSVVNALLLRSLPFRDANRLALLHTYLVPHDSTKQFHDWRQESAYLADAAVFEQFDVNLGSEQDLMRAHVAQASWNFFSLLGTQPVLGRGFSSGEDTRGRNAVAVIGYGLWQQLFGGDKRVLGSTIRVNGMPLTVIGVAPPGFSYPANTVLWNAADFTPGNNGWETVARLKPGITWPQARAAFAAEVSRLWPPGSKLRNLEKARITSLRDELAGPVKNASLLLMAGVALILLLACTNIANLLLARNADRTAEFSIRSALGASSARLLQQLLTECLLLSAVAGMAGLVVAFWTTSIAARVQPAPLATQSYSILDGRVLGFALAVSTISGLLFGILPSLDAGRVHAFGVRGSGGIRSSRLIRESLVAAQVMLTLVLLTASVSVGRAFLNLMRIDRGFDVKGLVTVNVSLEGTTYQSPEQQIAYFEEALARIRRLPGVRSASETEFLPLYATGFIGAPWGIDGRPARQSSMMVPVFPDYFKTMRGRILYGREFTEAEVRSDAPIAVVNDRFAREFGAPADALGHQLTLGNTPSRKIIGVVKAMDYMTEGANPTQMFLPANSPGSFFSTFVVRVNGRAEDHVAMIRDAIRSVDMRVPVFGAKTMEQRLDDALSRPKFYRTALLFFAGFALLLVVIGICGVVSYAISRRTHEMGVRLALGTTPIRLRKELLGQGLLAVATGAILGIAGAALTGRFLENLVNGAKPLSLTMFTMSILFIFAIASTSIWAATRRIATLDIMEILRID
ncbi:MAG: ABC transporter permease [Acidobacteriaceae bacterium]|nr:ABC transporter permease [Acidobacteriaceae bacterium]